MSRLLKLPGELKQWKVISSLPEQNGNSVFEVSKKEYDGTITSAKLIYVVFSGENYTSEKVDFINEEADFIKNISKTGSISIYTDVFVNNTPTKEKIELYIITENLTPLSERLKSEKFSENEIVDFGVKLSEILERLEANNVYHGNICPDNVFITPDGGYKLGGFTDFEGNIEDMSFVAPEISKNGQADFTTDIYSLGLIMYYMCNGNTLPFITDGVDRQTAVNERLEGKTVPAPQNGSEKLKSVIVIACQPENKNRWKNAGNIKNALTSIKAEMPAAKPNKDVIIPQNTDFDGNVFEEYEYEPTEQDNSARTPAVEAEPREVTPQQNDAADAEPQDEPQPDGNNGAEHTELHESTDNTADSSNDDSQHDAVEPPKEDTADKIISEIKKPEDEIDNRVFDDYEPTKVIDFKQKAKEKDYGSYFDDEPEQKPEEKAPEQNDEQKDEKPQKTKNLDFDYDFFSSSNSSDEDKDSDIPEKTKKSKTGIIVLIVAILVILAVLGTAGYFAFTNHWFGLGATEETTEEPATTIAETTQKATDEPTTAEPTTEEPTTEAQVDKFVPPVIGYGYYYAKEVLENEGFVVQIGEYRYSTTYEEGYVIAQYPDSSSIAQTGSTVTLDVSSGLINDDSNSSDKSNNSDNNTNSDSSYYGNSSYMSQSEVEKMSDKELNYALNEIYARRGRIFTTPELAEYFNAQPWYTPKYTPEEFSKYVVFNEYEEANLQLLINEEQKRGNR